MLSLSSCVSYYIVGYIFLSIVLLYYNCGFSLLCNICRSIKYRGSVDPSVCTLHFKSKISLVHTSRERQSIFYGPCTYHNILFVENPCIIINPPKGGD